MFVIPGNQKITISFVNIFLLSIKQDHIKSQNCYNFWCSISSSLSKSAKFQWTSFFIHPVEFNLEMYSVHTCSFFYSIDYLCIWHTGLPRLYSTYTNGLIAERKQDSKNSQKISFTGHCKKLKNSKNSQKISFTGHCKKYFKNQAGGCRLISYVLKNC